MTRLFREGRTETVRPCTIESAAWVRAMVGNTASVRNWSGKVITNCKVPTVWMLSLYFRTFFSWCTSWSSQSETWHTSFHCQLRFNLKLHLLCNINTRRYQDLGTYLLHIQKELMKESFQKSFLDPSDIWLTMHETYFRYPLMSPSVTKFRTTTMRLVTSSIWCS